MQRNGFDKLEKEQRVLKEELQNSIAKLNEARATASVQEEKSAKPFKAPYLTTDLQIHMSKAQRCGTTEFFE